MDQLVLAHLPFNRIWLGSPFDPIFWWDQLATVLSKHRFDTPRCDVTTRAARAEQISAAALDFPVDKKLGMPVKKEPSLEEMRALGRDVSSSLRKTHSAPQTSFRRLLKVPDAELTRESLCAFFGSGDPLVNRGRRQQLQGKDSAGVV